MPRTCPTTSDATSERSHLLKCDQTYRYHCMRDKEDEIVEKCLKISWIQKGDCAVYDKEAQKIDSWTCIERQGICPKEVYFSNQVMSYSACVPLPEKTNVTREKDVFKTSTIPSDGSQFVNNDSTPLLWIIGSVFALIVVIAIIIAFVIYKRRKRLSKENSSQAYPVKDGGDAISDFEENMPLTTSTVSNENCHGSRAQEEKKYDASPYYKTETYEHIEDLVKNSSVGILILGEPGSGKSVIAEMLYERFRLGNDTHCTSKLLENLNKIDEQRRDKNSKMIFIIDDCFEDWIQYPYLVSTCLEQLQSVYKSVVEENGNCLVLTISKNNFESNLDAVQKLKFKEINIIDLSSKKFNLDITDRTGILEYHRKKKGLTTARMEDKNLRKITDPRQKSSFAGDCNLEFEFPLSCHLFYLHESFEEKQELFFVWTNTTVLEFVRGLRNGSEEEKCQYCTLIYIVLCGGQVQALKKQKQRKDLLEDIARAKGMNVTGLKLRFDYGCCLITEGKDNTYKIVHEEITKSLFVSFGDIHPRLVLEKSDFDALLKFIRTDKARYGKLGFLVIAENMYDLLVARFKDKDGSYEKHVIFQDEQFLKRFREITEMMDISSGLRG